MRSWHEWRVEKLRFHSVMTTLTQKAILNNTFAFVKIFCSHFCKTATKNRTRAAVAEEERRRRACGPRCQCPEEEVKAVLNCILTCIKTATAWTWFDTNGRLTFYLCPLHYLINYVLRLAHSRRDHYNKMFARIMDDATNTHTQTRARNIPGIFRHPGTPTYNCNRSTIHGVRR